MKAAANESALERFTCALSDGLRYEVCASRDNVLWRPLSSWCRDAADAIVAADTEVELRERTDADEWIGVYDHKKHAVIWKCDPKEAGSRPARRD